MKEKKTKSEFKFKPFDSIEWNEVSENEVLKVLDKEQFKTLKNNKHYSTAIGTFKVN